MAKSRIFNTITIALSFVCPAAVAATCTYSGGQWDRSPAEGDDIVIDSGDLVWNSSLPMTVGSWTQNESYENTVTFDTGLETFVVSGNVTLKGGSWTHTANPSFSQTSEGWISGRGSKQLIVQVGGNFDLSAGASINVVNKGFVRSQGPGGGAQGRGASHGGCGNGATRKCYGSFSRPVMLGSGGRDYAGGGAVRLTVAGQARIDGSVNANSNAGSGDFHGAGGSVLIEASAISGSGEISADGGGYGNNSNAGGGGRIALILTGEGDFSSFAGSVHAYSNGKSTQTHKGSCGTIYYEKKSDVAGAGTLVIKGRSTAFPGQSAELIAGEAGVAYDFSELIISNCGVLAVHSNVTVRAANLMSFSNSKSRIRLDGGRMEIPEGAMYTNISIVASTPGSEIACGGAHDLVLGNGAQLIANNATFETTNLVMKAGSSIEHSANGASEQYRLNIVVYADAHIEEGAKVSANEKGLNGAKTMPDGSTTAGCHGGIVSTAPSEAAYGSLKYPVNMGSAPVGRAEYGGGAIKMTVYGDLILDGGIEAIGATSHGAHQSPAGGSIWLTVSGALSGSGNISANGGYSKTSSNQCGSGGRVAVYLTKAGESYDGFFASGGVIEASGANSQDNKTSSAPWGGPGTVYLSKIVNGAAEGTLVIANRNSTQRQCAATIGVNVTDAEVDHVEIASNGVLKIGRDATLKVSGNFFKHPKGVFVAESGDAEHVAGNIEFNGAGESLITGTNEFARLSCKTPGKTIRFGSANDTLTRILSFGGLDIAGAQDSPVKLLGVDAETPWIIDAVSGSDNNVAFAEVKNSNAGAFGGSAIIAKDSVDAGGNENWIFPTIVAGEKNTWTGAADRQWGNPANWDLQRTPVETDVIVISADAPNMPYLPAAVKANSLSIESGASLTLAGYFLTVTNELRVAGSLVCEASETVEFSGNVLSFSDGSFSKASSTFLITGGGAQSIDVGGNVFNVVRIAKDGGSVFFADGLEAYQIRVENATSSVDASFAAGSTVSADDVFIDITDAEKLLVMRSSLPGEKWNFAVSRIARVSGVAVSDCNASALEIYDDLPGADLGGNSRWHFGVDLCKWTGAVSASFTNGANWAGGIAPGASSRVQFLSDAEVVLESPVSVRQFEVLAGEVVFAAATNGALNVTRSGTIDGGATLSMNIPMSVGSDFVLRSGATLTHRIINSTDLAKGITNRIDLSVGRNMVIEEGGIVTATAKGFGYGGVKGGLGYTARGDCPPSHGSTSLGRGASVYGSVFAPIHPGSSCTSSDVGNTAGGVIRLRVGGTLTVDGAVSADSDRGNWYVATPGSIWITAGDLSGSGDIGADAGAFSHVSGDNVVGGGRVAVILTEGAFSGWSGVITANPNIATMSGNFNVGSPGTVYLETAADGDKGGCVYVVNTLSANRRTVPADCVTMFPGRDEPSDFERVKFVVGAPSRIGFAENMRIADIMFEKRSNAALANAEMNDCKVKVAGEEHRDGKGWDWPYADVVLPGDAGIGGFVWNAIGFRIILR